MLRVAKGTIESYAERIIAPEWHSQIATGGLSLAFAILLGTFNQQIKRIIDISDVPETAIIYFLMVFVGAVALYKVKYKELPAILVSITRLTALGFFIYHLIEPPDYTLSNPENINLLYFINIGYWFAFLATILSFWRPSFLFPSATYAILSRYLVEDISGYTISTLDIRYMVEMAQFLSVGICCIVYLKHKRRDTKDQRQSLIDLEQFALCLVFIAIGFHLGNYFWSGVAKLVLGPYPWTWALENNTQNIILMGIKRGVFPFGHLPDFSHWLFIISSGVVIYLNILVLISQLFALLAIAKMVWLRIASILFDVLHIGIYLLSGVLFWPWIWINLTIIWTIKNSDDRKIGLTPKICCALVILLGGTKIVSKSANLAWWDTLDVKVPYFQVRTNDNGPWITVPVSFFMNHSFSVSTGYIDRSKVSGHYAPSIWASIQSYDRYKTSGTCPVPKNFADAENARTRGKRLAKAKAFIISHHKKMLSRVNKDGWYNFYLFSHHHPSNPMMHRNFNKIDLRNVTSYRLVTESVCLTLQNGKLKEQLLKQDEIIIDVRK